MLPKFLSNGTYFDRNLRVCAGMETRFLFRIDETMSVYLAGM